MGRALDQTGTSAPQGPDCAMASTVTFVRWHSAPENVLHRSVELDTLISLTSTHRTLDAHEVNVKRPGQRAMVEDQIHA